MKKEKESEITVENFEDGQYGTQEMQCDEDLMKEIEDALNQEEED